jgi:CheY-like chemotaxis protein
MPFCILHVEDEPDIREVVQLSLGLDPDITTRSCASAKDALVEAADWLPDLILCDVMMPVMDGPTFLKRLRENPQTARIPVVFMTARAQTQEAEQFLALGACGVIAKPFDPTTLAGIVRAQLWNAKIAAVNDGFGQRLQTDAALLIRCRAALALDSASWATLDELRDCAHKLAGAAGIFGFGKVSAAACELEESIIERHSGGGRPGGVEADLSALIACIGENQRGAPRAGAARDQNLIDAQIGVLP